MSCEQCNGRERELLETRRERDYLAHLIGSIRKTLEYAHEERPRGRQPREYATEAGKLIAATASAKRMKLSAVSKAIGYGPDQVAKVCRGDAPLTRRLAILIGGALGIDLLGYVGNGSNVHPAESETQPALPGAAGGA